jgi:glycosyltransferase involved in cell wall biosynthesis
MSDPTPVVRLLRNDWGPLRPPPIGGWTPTRTVSVVIPAYNCQDKLDLTLASLSAQTYPAHLLEVVVVDDGSQPPLELPAIRPENCRIIRAGDAGHGWGRAFALHTGAEASTGEILHWLDADMVVFPEHIEAQARWHDLIPDAVTIGYKRFVASGWGTAEEIAKRCADGTIGTLFTEDETEPHAYVEDRIAETNELRDVNHVGFLVHVGATATVRRDLYREAGGFATDLRLAEDTDLGYRLAQAGAVFIPEPEARSWHLGRSHMMTVGDALRRYNKPIQAARTPLPRGPREDRGRIWAVPLIIVVIRAEGSFELVRACVDRVLVSVETDLRVHLVGDWNVLTGERRRVLDDPHVDLRLLEENYRSDPRVVLVTDEPETAFPSAFLLCVPTTAGLPRKMITRLTTDANWAQAGLARVGSGAVPAGDGAPGTPTVELWRTAALSRARRVMQPGENLADVVEQVHGAIWVSGDRFIVTDLTSLSTEQLEVNPLIAEEDRATVEVGGLRSLVRATGFVAGLTVRTALRRLTRSGRSRVAADS